MNRGSLSAVRYRVESQPQGQLQSTRTLGEGMYQNQVDEKGEIEPKISDCGVGRVVRSQVEMEVS